MVAEVKLEGMDDNTVDKRMSKVEFEVALKDYHSHYFVGDHTHKHERGWSAIW